MRRILIDIYKWWATTLASCLPGRRSPAKLGKHILISKGDMVLADEDGAILEACNDGQVTDFIAEVVRKAGRKPLSILISANRFLERNLTLLQLRESHSRDMILLDVVGSTPFDIEDIYMLRGQARGFDVKGVNYQILRRSVLAPLLSALKKSKLPVGEIRLERGRGYWLVDQKTLGTTERLGFLGGLNAVSIFLAIAVCLVTFVHLHVRNATAIVELGARLDGLETQAASVRKILAQRKEAIERLNAIQAFRNSNPAIVAVWEQLTQFIPDSAFLTDLEVSQSTVRLSGFADSAAELLPALEAAPLFESVEFIAPVVKVPGREREHFAMLLKVAK